MKDMPILERRRIEAQILKHVHDVIAARSGIEEADAVIGTAVSRSAIDQGRDFANALGHTPSLQDFADIMPLWEKEDALRVEMVEASSEKLEFNIVRCRYAEMYREMGLGRIGHLLSCNRDGDFCVGYNPQMKLTRTQTIMSGASHCDFRYRLEPDADKPGNSQ
ncbi:L-2-amino-thiazoline-4-carboxylic acid hydrolase [Nitrobacteraceae bacterium UC4446_H13]